MYAGPHTHTVHVTSKLVDESFSKKIYVYIVVVFFLFLLPVSQLAVPIAIAGKSVFFFLFINASIKMVNSSRMSILCLYDRNETRKKEEKIILLEKHEVHDSRVQSIHSLLSSVMWRNDFLMHECKVPSLPLSSPSLSTPSLIK